MTSLEHGDRIRRIDYEAVHASLPFGELRRSRRMFVIPACLLFLSWYFTFVLLAAFAPRFMARQVLGHVTMGLVLGLSQFVLTFAVTVSYSWWARLRLDPLAAWMRSRVDKGTQL